MFLNVNVQQMLCTLSASMENANTKAEEVSSSFGSLVSQMLENLYEYWNPILEAEATDSKDQNQYNLDSTKAQNQENTLNSDVSSINTDVSNLSSAMKQLSSFASTVTNFMQVIASLISTKLG